MTAKSRPVDSVCVYCGSSDAADPEFLTAATRLGQLLAADDVRLIYGGGGVGLMGATARAARDAGGRVLGVIPDFLRGRERPVSNVETVVVDTMHERKMMMFERADAFIVLPGGIGTLEEIIELLSWRRLDLHAKPTVFYNPRGFWDPLFHLFDHIIAEKLMPLEFNDSWRAVDKVEDILPAVFEMAQRSPETPEEAITTALA
jgi:uncharacterized protein (TIGR00730 family)